MHRIFKTYLITFFFVIIGASNLSANELQIPSRTASPGQKISIPLKVDEVENLAGLKIVLSYDYEILEYKSAEKTAATSSLMHVVNDKKPGRLIIVMAGAKGIGGKNLELIRLEFRIKENRVTSEAVETEMKISEAEMMSDQLKQLDYKVILGKIRIIP